MHDKAIEAACLEFSMTMCGQPVPIPVRTMRGALRAFLASVEPSATMCDAAAREMEKQCVAFELDSPLWFPAKTFTAMSAKLADELSDDSV